MIVPLAVGERSQECLSNRKLETLKEYYGNPARTVKTPACHHSKFRVLG